MPIEQMRSLSLLIFGAVTGSWLSGDFETYQWMIYVSVLLPLWTPLALDRIRRWRLWSVLVYITIIGFGVSQYFGLNLKSALFFLILTCVVYEVYGETRNEAPAKLLGLLSFLFLVAQIRSEFNLNKFFCVVLYNLGLLAALVTFTNGGIPLKKGVRGIGRGIGTIVLHVAVITALGLGIFWTLPRISEESNAVIADFYEQNLSGFGDTVDLNDISSLKSQRQHVLDVTPLEGQGLHSRYLKGRVLEIYDKGVWTSLNNNVSYTGNEQTRVLGRVPARLDEPVYEYRVDLNATRERVLFFFDNFVALEGPVFPLAIQGGGADLRKFSFDRGYGTSLSYVVKASRTPLAAELGNARPFLYVPRQMQYLADYTDRVLGSQELEPLQAARQLENYFQSNYDYSLEINNFGVADPIRHFITTRSGHCELFASTMALMLRSRGVPTRLALGFLLPRKNHYSDFYHVTTEEAHAWVEVYDGNTWRSFDPTAPTALEQANFWISDRVEYFKWLFRRTVVTYDQEQQWSLVQQFPVWLATNRNYVLLIFILAAASYFSKMAYHRYRWRTSPAQLPHRVAALQRSLEKRHGLRRTDERFDRYIHRISLQSDLKEGMLGFYKSYQQWRFASASNVAVRDLFRDLDQLEQQLSQDH